MHIEKIHIKNFRLLEDIEISLDEKATVIVGRNNSGKTSFAELFRRISTESSPNFKLEDFTMSKHIQFWEAYNILQQNHKDEERARKTLPSIEMEISVDYKNDSSYGVLSDFIIDLNPNCTVAHIKMCYQLEEGKMTAFFDDIRIDSTLSESEQKRIFFRVIKERVPRFYKMFLMAVDPNDVTNQKKLDWKKIQDLVRGSFVNAQRELGDMTNKEKDVLGKILEGLFNSAKSESASLDDRKVTENINITIQKIQGELDIDFNNQLKNLLPAISLFGYPGLRDPNLITETLLNIDTLLKNYTKIRYSGLNGVHLPESYNGLGARNLIFILLRMLEFYKEFIAKKPRPMVHLIFIEEPEAHLHPQMQEVFISKLNELSSIFSKQYNNGEPWPVQFVVTTHSSHMANKAEFSSMRYFMTTNNHNTSDFYTTKVKDFKAGVAGALGNEVAFLQQYMTLTRCDLLFADKAILIEGSTERLLLPKMIEKLDKDNGEINLGSQYITVMEVGGAYAHNFFKLLDFLELKTLIITDLDTVDSTQNNSACKVSAGNRTSNACIKTWFQAPEITPNELIKKTVKEKISGVYRIAYQVPEFEQDDMPCGRSFEEAFILANLQLFGINETHVDQAENQAWDIARKVKKVQFALEYALEKTEWNIPRYIKEGLLWLGANKIDDTDVPSNIPIPFNMAEVAVAKEESHD
ncbi:ATP-dependent nuclease [Brevibacillus parabrevis]|uniref:ATP-dependent nuclease n=1 Tax=Brevibacillus parabrevis TaxID=54914 RepID=UPI001F611133|nr:AAA family ATPase [Brevibacillus parabrevis]